jgi:hypothetical protein
MSDPRLYEDSRPPFYFMGGINIAPTTSSATAALVGSGRSILVTNYGSVAIFVEQGASTVTATTASQCVLPGDAVLLSRLMIDDATQPAGASKRLATHIAHITAADTGSGQISTGNGE